MSNPEVIIIGGGFTGLTAALEMQKHGIKPIVIEMGDQPGGLAGSFEVNGTQLEKFYHHWFKSDEHIHTLVEELGKSGEIVYRQTKTGSYYANSLFRLSSPLDLLSYTPLSFIGRIRLGLLVFQAQMVKDWRKIEHLKAVDWLKSMCGNEVYEMVWKPLLAGKFGKFASEIGAVWMWNKLALRGGSRDKSGKEILAYYQGGFASLSQAMMDQIIAQGGEVHLRQKVERIETEAGKLSAVITDKVRIEASTALATIPQPIFADIVSEHTASDYVEQLKSIDYLGNVCMVMELDRSLSDTYWINVADPDFPFVGVIEHTNFEPPETYGGKHIVYLSKYLPTDTDMYNFNEEEMLDFAMPHLQRMFPKFQRNWVIAAHLFKSDYTQPIVKPDYSKLIPDVKTPIEGFWLSSMAQIYPEDRGTNYAVREGRVVGDEISKTLAKQISPATEMVEYDAK